MIAAPLAVVIAALGTLGAAAGAVSAAPAPLRLQGGPGAPIELRAGEERVGVIDLITAPAARGAPALRELQVDGHRVVELRVPVQGRPRTEVWLGLLEGPRAELIWSGLVGPRDADGESSVELAVDQRGITVFETAARVVRCDRQKVRLFARRFDFARKQMVDEVPPPAAAGPTGQAVAVGTVIVARRLTAAPAARPRVRFAFSVASEPPAEAPRRDARALLAPLALSDGDPDTVWTERGPADGRGSFFTARAAGGDYQVVGLRVWPGDLRSPRAYQASGRPRALQLIFGAGPAERFEVTLDEAELQSAEARRRPFWIPLPKPVTSGCVTVQVRDVLAGQAAPAKRVLAVSDIEVVTDLDGETGAARLVKSLEGLACEARVSDVVALGPAVLPAVIVALGQTPAGQRECALDALSGLLPAGGGSAAAPAANTTTMNPLSTPSAPPAAASTAAPDDAAAKALSDALPAALRGASAGEETRIVALLRRMVAPPVEALAVALADAQLAPEERVRAARALAALEREDAQVALVAAAGQGPAPVRAAVRDLLAAGGGEVQLQAALAATPAAAAGRRADLVQALGARAAGGAGAAAVRELLTTLALSESEAFEVRARALAALVKFSDPVAVAALGHLRGGAAAPPLRALAVRALAGNPHADAVTALRAAVQDADPGVREAAVAALGTRRDRGFASALVVAAKQEPWPFVRRAEVIALGQLCGQPATDLLVRALERDAPDIRRAALAGLVSCKDGRAPGAALALLRRTQEPAPLRTQAAALLGELRNPTTAGELSEALDQLVLESRADLALEATVTASVRALGEIGGPPALSAALRLRADQRPTLRRAALETLGRLCDRQRGAAALQEASRDPDASVAAAARAGLRRCGSPGETRSSQLGAEPNR